MATLVIGLTGGIGMGKSTAATLLEKHDVTICDTDILARQIVQPGQPGLEEIRKTFGEQVIAQDGSLRRHELATLVFRDPDKRRRLEAITHPRIRELWSNQVRRWRTGGTSRGVVVIPLLFETNAVEEFDFIICVACSTASQRRRLSARGWREEEIDQRISAQWPVQKKMDLSTFVVWTEPGLDVHEAQLRRILRF